MRKEHTGRFIHERFDFRDSRRLNYTLSGTERIDGAREGEKSKEMINYKELWKYNFERNEPAREEGD